MKMGDEKQEEGHLVSIPEQQHKEPHFTKEVPIPLPDLNTIHNTRIILIRTSWNDELVSSVYNATKNELLKQGIRKENFTKEIVVGGCYELPYAAKIVAKKRDVDVVVCFGVLIKGETSHYEYLSNAVSEGLMQVQLNSEVPVVYGVLNCLTKQQAEDRCGPTSQLPFSLAATALNIAGLKRKEQIF